MEDQRRCIWCNKSEKYTSFNNDAHTIPQSLGGNRVCKDVCDECNSYFGSPGKNKIAIEVALKELLNISRFIVYDTHGEIGKNKKFPRFKSTYFEYDKSKRKFKLKKSFVAKTHLSHMIAKQFRKGIYKIFLEEYHMQTGLGHIDNFDFIREFARYNLDDLPVIYFHPRMPAFLYTKEEFENPSLILSPHQKNIMTQFRFAEFRLLSHQFAIPVIRNFKPWLKDYIEQFISENSSLFEEFRNVKSLSDFDIFHSYIK